MFVGPDMCGKTNISQELSKRLQIPYFKPSEEKLTFLNNQDKFVLDAKYADTRMADFLKQTKHSVIFARNIVTGKQIGRASCRERVSSPV